MFGAMYQTGYAGLRSCGVTQSISKRSHPLQSEVSLTGLSAAKSFLNELLLRSPGSLAWLPSGVTTRGTITGFLPNRKGSTRLRISGCPSNSSNHGPAAIVSPRDLAALTLKLTAHYPVDALAGKMLEFQEQLQGGHVSAP